VLSRARYIASQLEQEVRIVGLSAPIANAMDVSEWIGVPSKHLFNFKPDDRPAPLLVNLFGFDTNSHQTRLQSMAKPVYRATVDRNPACSTIIFVPSKKLAHSTAADLIAFSTNEGRGEAFLGPNMEILRGKIAPITDTSLRESLNHGIAVLHQGLSSSNQDVAISLFKSGSARVLVCPHDMCWHGLPYSHQVVIMDSSYYDGRQRRFVQYAFTDIMQMMGIASLPLPSYQEEDSSINMKQNVCVLLCHSPKKEYLKRLINEPLPVESHLDQYLHDHMCAEIVNRTIENKQEAVDYLTWTLFYRRLTQNPNYYNMLGASHRHLSDHLSELVENTVGDLEESKCITVEDEMDLGPLNLGMISSFYYIQYTTIELFASGISAKTRVKGLLEVLASASEFNQ
jgi:pre-mRNA-splicing helicase BRR2